MPQFSLIVATMGRTEELDRLCATLAAQTFQGFEVILVDQNPDDRLCPIVQTWSARFALRHLRSEPGLSRCRNKGIEVAVGDLMAFPDDDCWYPPDTLEKVSLWFDSHPEYAFLSGCAQTEDSRLTSNRWLIQPCAIGRTNVFRSAISFTLFFRAKAIRAVEGFDPSLGLGSGTPWGSGEESDCIFRLLAAGYTGWYDNRLIIHHPDKTPDTSESAQSRAQSYGVGFGYLLRRHKLPLLYSMYQCARPVGGWLIARFRRRTSAPLYLATLRGRLKGYFSSQARSSAALPMD